MAGEIVVIPNVAPTVVIVADARPASLVVQNPNPMVVYEGGIGGFTRIRGKVGAGGGPIAGSYIYTLMDANGVPIKNRGCIFFRERDLQYDDDDFNYDPTNGRVTVYIPFILGPNGGEHVDFWLFSISSIATINSLGIALPGGGGFPYTLPFTLTT